MASSCAALRDLVLRDTMGFLRSIDPLPCSSTHQQMSLSLANCAAPIRRLRSAVERLQHVAAPLELPPLAGREWYELLTEKLVPQLTDDAFLIVAVVGGTNIGKTVVFNHIAGSRASSTSPLASGTRHPTCLVPEGFAESHELAELFPDFTLAPSTDPGQALQDSDTNWLFWREETSLPANLLVLDTPDIDSEVRINWKRADGIRRCADVLIALLTQQKYNDAAVKEFFRKAAAEDKAVMIVFNQVQLPEDEEYWPLWVGTFCDETGVKPERVYLAPYNRRAAEANELPFYERDAMREAGGGMQNETAPDPGTRDPHLDQPRSLLEDLSQLHFAEIKLRTLRGSIECLTEEQAGVPSYLAEVASHSGDFAAAAELLSTHQLAEIKDWPQVPNPLLVAQIRQWWAEQREGWTAHVHGFYNALGRGLLWPVRAIRDYVDPEALPPWERYRQREWQAILEAVEKVYAKLTWMSEIGNPLLRPRLDSLLSGTSRKQLLEVIETAHREVDLQDELRRLVTEQLSTFRTDSPQSYEFFRRLDGIAAAARPATSVVLFVAGGPVGHALTEAAGQSLIQVAGEFASGTVAAAVGETAISGTTASGVGYLEAKFRRMHVAFTAQRAAWLGGLLKEHLLGTLPEQMHAAAAIPHSAEMNDVRHALDELEQTFREPASVLAE
jgi:hypothetical protein